VTLSPLLSVPIIAISSLTHTNNTTYIIISLSYHQVKKNIYDLSPRLENHKYCGRAGAK
jgi:hypothetical protein